MKIFFQPTTRSDLIDEKVVDGHVIPHHVLFTKATPDTKEFETLAFSDNVKVIVSFSTAMNGREEISKYKLYKHSLQTKLDPSTNGRVLFHETNKQIPIDAELKVDLIIFNHCIF